MSQVTSEQLSLLRSRPQRTKLNLSIFRPTTVMKCRLNNASIARNDRVIAYDTVTEGGYTAVEAGMTLLVGTTDGGDELGRVRIRSVDASEFTVAENSYILWEDNAYLTVLRFWDVWPVYPRIIQDPSDPEDTIWYKDYDIAYTNQNRYLGAFPCAGPHRAAYLENGSATIYYTATGTHHVLDTAYNTEWFFEGATTTGSSAFTPGNISYDTAGHYVTRLTVTGSHFVDTTYRYVSIYDENNPPILHWEMVNIDGSRAGGGYSTTIKVWETIDIREGDVVVLFGDTWIHNVKQTIGGNADGNSDIFFVGHILQNSIRYDYRTGETTFEVGSITKYIKGMEGFSVSVESRINPSDWYELYQMDIESATYHYLKWHTTVLSVADVQALLIDRPIQFFDSDRESIYDAIDSLARGTVLGLVHSDMQGKIYSEMGAQSFYWKNLPYRTQAMTIQKGDWVNTPSIEEQLMPQFSYLEYGGIQFNGDVSGTFKPLMAEAPGDAPLYRGKAERKQGLALKSKTELKKLIGYTLANYNYPYQRIDYQMVGTFRNLDIAPQTTVGVIIDSEDTPRGEYISGTFLVDSVTWNYDSRSQLFIPNRVSLVPFTSGTRGQGVQGQDIEIPETPPSPYNPPKFNSPTPPVPQYYAPQINARDYIQVHVNTYTFGTNTHISWTEQRKKAGISLSWDGDEKVVFEYSGWYAVSLNMRVTLVNSRSEQMTGFSILAYDSNSVVLSDWTQRATHRIVTKSTGATYSGLGHHVTTQYYFNAGDYIRVSASLVFFESGDSYVGDIAVTKLA